MKKMMFVCSLFLLAFSLAAENPNRAVDGHRPETWFHLINGNVAREGIVADLDAIRDAGIGGIQLFHGGGGNMGGVFPGMEKRQIPCLSADWDDLIAFVARECRVRGLTFKMQNCPGWSMSGGPWIRPAEAMRILVCGRQDVSSDGCVPVPDRLPELQTVHTAQPKTVSEPWRDVREIAVVAFPAQPDDGAFPEPSVTTDDPTPTNKVLAYSFDRPVTVRSVTLPSPRAVFHDRCYEPGIRVTVTAEDGTVLRAFDYPHGCWQDYVPLTVACRPATSRRFTVSVAHKWKKCEMKGVTLSPLAQYDNWQGEAGWTLRGLLDSGLQPPTSNLQPALRDVRVVTPGKTVLPKGRWTVMRFAHVNAGRRNGPAPQEATGWECDKLDAHGIERNFANYIGRLADGPLAGGLLDGMVVDSWECERPNWTWKMGEYFRSANGYDVTPFLPALFGYVLGTPAETAKFLLDWRRTVAELIERNYYGRMSELAHAAGLEVAYETAYGDVLPGDLLAFWKYCDTPMCEFWQPYTPTTGGVGHPSYKPVRPCVSAAHVYGKKRVACESFTNVALTWDENFRALKEQAVRHYARGVTHLVFHTCTHQPQTDGRKPGTSFGAFIGTPFVRGQTWWPYMKPFTDWIATCGEFLERGLPQVDVLRYLGDDLDHKPDELEPFTDGFKNDYLNADVLFNRLTVKDGRFVLPDGLSYAAVWVPDTVVVAPKTRARLAALAAQGGRVVYGSAAEATKGLKPQLVAASDRGDGAQPLWYHRAEKGWDGFFVAADDRGFQGTVTLRTAFGEKKVGLDLGAYETLLVSVDASGVRDDARDSIQGKLAESPRRKERLPIEVGPWELSFPAGWGAPEKIRLERLVPWKDLPGVSEEGRSFSGTAVYRTTLRVPKCPEKGQFVLDLGDVRDFALVRLNGNAVARLWAAPYRADIGGSLKPGDNELEIEVTSTWWNRLWYDARQKPEDRKSWTVWHTNFGNAPCVYPRPNITRHDSGLLGPLTLDVIAPDGWEWHDAKTLTVEGLGFEDPRYRRLPESLKGKVPDDILEKMGAESTGVSVAFVPQTERVCVRWTVADRNKTDVYMGPVAMTGLDLYAYTPEKGWRLATCQRYGDYGWAARGSWAVCSCKPGQPMRAYLPLRSQVNLLAVGVPAGGRVDPLPRHPVARRVVHYGTSIVHGGCVSRPGLAFTSIYGRLADVEVINLGFSGRGQMETNMCETVSSIDAGLYVLDCDWNMSVAMQQERYEPFVRTLNRRRPDAAILLCGGCTQFDEPRAQEKFARGVYDKLKKEDPVRWKNLHFLSGVEMLPKDGESTFDFCHPNDWGAMHMGPVYAKKIVEILGK